MKEQLNLPTTTNILGASMASLDEYPVIGMENLNVTNSGVASTSENIRGITDQENEPNTAEPSINRNRPSTYTKFQFFQLPHREFDKQFFKNLLGTVCSICDRIWFKM